MLEGERVDRDVHRALDRVLDADEAEVDLAASAAASTSAIVAIGTSSSAARSAWESSACSVKVPSGPRKPTRRRASMRRRPSRGAMLLTWTKQPSWDCWRRSGRATCTRRRRGRAAPAPVRRPRLRAGRPPPRPAPGPARSGLRPGKAPEHAPPSSASCSTPAPARAAHPSLRRAGRRRLAAQPGRQPTAPPSCGGRPRRARAGGDRRPPAPPTCPVADECAAVLEAFGIEPNRLTDVGVAGVHRLLGEADAWPPPTPWSSSPAWRVRCRASSAASPRARSSPSPPASGYGAGLEGVTALLAMLASCAAGLTVVGIDNGYGAACAVARMLK